MTEAEFWDFLNGQRSAHPPKVYAGSLESDSIETPPEVLYLIGHALLPANYQEIPEEKTIAIGKLLFRKNIKNETKEAVLILLAHMPHKSALSTLTEYSKDPDENLRTFAEMALDECMLWNEN